MQSIYEWIWDMGAQVWKLEALLLLGCWGERVLFAVLRIQNAYKIKWLWVSFIEEATAFTDHLSIFGEDSGCVILWREPMCWQPYKYKAVL